MDKQAVASSGLQRYLANGLQKRLGLDITGGSADFCNNDICICLFLYRIDKGFDLIGDMGDDLHGLTEIFSSSFFI